LFVLLVCY